MAIKLRNRLAFIKARVSRCAKQNKAKHRRQFIKTLFSRKIAIAAFVILILMILSLLIMIFGNILIGLVERRIPQTSYFFEILLHFRTLFVWFVLTIFIALMYTYVPGGKLGFKMQLPGAVVAAVGWSIITWFFSIYVDRFNGFSTYGSLTTIIILMLWLYSCMYIVMMGAFLNRYFKPAFQFFIGKRKAR